MSTAVGLILFAVACSGLWALAWIETNVAYDADARFWGATTVTLTILVSLTVSLASGRKRWTRPKG